MTRRFIVAITGASGCEYALRFLWRIAQLPGETDLVLSPNFAKVLDAETDLRLEGGSLGQIQNIVRSRYGSWGDIHTFTVYDYHDISARAASGSASYAAMIILPCSMRTLAAIAHGLSQNLIERAADVSIKERRRLILCPRETPLSAIHLKNMLALTEAGATILPLMPGYYHKPKTLVDLYDFMVDRILQHLEFRERSIPPWGG